MAGVAPVEEPVAPATAAHGDHDRVVLLLGDPEGAHVDPGLASVAAGALNETSEPVETPLLPLDASGTQIEPGYGETRAQSLAIVPFDGASGAGVVVKEEGEEESKVVVAYSNQAVAPEQQGQGQQGRGRKRRRRGAGGGEGGDKDGWETVLAWLWSLPKRRNVLWEEVEEWLQANRHRLSREIISMPRVHLFRYLVSQHKLMRRTEQKEELELVEPPTARFKRSDKWRPVYAWLESLDSGHVVGAKVIEEWLVRNPTLRSELLSKHTRHHLFHYIQKCHSALLKKRKKQALNGGLEKRKEVKKVSERESVFAPGEGSGRNSISDPLSHGVELNRACFRGGSDDAQGVFLHDNPDVSKGKSLLCDQSRRDSHYVRSQSEEADRSCFKNGLVGIVGESATDDLERRKQGQQLPITRTGEVQMYSNRQTVAGKTQNSQDMNSQSLSRLESAGDRVKYHLEDADTRLSMDKSEARRRYEILMELQTRLWDVIVHSKEQIRGASSQVDSFLSRPSTSATPIPSSVGDELPNRPGSSLDAPVFIQNEDFEGRFRRKLRDSVHTPQESSGMVPSGHVRPRSSLESKSGKKRRKGKESIDKAIGSWTYSEVFSVSDTRSIAAQSVDLRNGNMPEFQIRKQLENNSEAATSSQRFNREVAQAPNMVKCLLEREKGAGSGSCSFPSQMVGRRYCRRWKTVLEGWDSLEKQFIGCAAWLQRKAYSMWLPSWSAYTSSVAVAAPIGMMDQGVQKVLDVRFHPHNLPQLVCSSNAAPNELLLYNLECGRVTELVGHNCQIQAVEYAANGNRIVSCGSNLVKIWDSTSGACLHTFGPRQGHENLPGHKKKINALAVNNQVQSCLLATSGGEGDSQLLLWNLMMGELVCDLNIDLRRKHAVLPCMDALEFCNENFLICGSDSTSGGPAIVQIWDVHTHKGCTSFPANDSYITCLKTDPSGTTIVTGAGDGTVGLFDVRSHGGIARFPLGSSCEVTSVSFSSCGMYFQASSTANRTLVWDTRMLPMDPGLTPLERTLDLVNGTSRKMRALHCLSHGAPMPTSENAGQLPGFVDEGDQGVNDAKWFHEAAVLVTCSGNGSIAMWNMSLGQPCVRHMISHSRCVNTVAVSPNDKYISSGGDDQKVVLYQNMREKSSTGWRLMHPLYDDSQNM